MDELELTDGVVVLRPPRVEWAEAHLAGDDAKNIRWLSGGVSTLETVQAWIERMRAHWAGGGPVYTFFVFVAATGQQVGMVDGNTDWPSLDGLTEGQANISYGIYPVARGQGYAVRAVGLIQSFLATKGVRDAVIRVDPANTASLALAIRAGFAVEGDILTRDGDHLRVHVRRISP